MKESETQIIANIIKRYEKHPYLEIAKCQKCGSIAYGVIPGENSYIDYYGVDRRLHCSRCGGKLKTFVRITRSAK